MMTWLFAIGGFLKRIPPLVWLILAIVALFAVTVMDRNKWKGRAERYNAEAAASYEATKLASGNAHLERKDTPQQIGELGKTIATLKAGIARQNAAVTAMGQKTAEQKEIAAKALRSAAQRVAEAKAVADRLEASARAGGRAGACEPSKELERQWR